MSELVTGDAVVLGLRTARLPSRALAVVIDLLLAWTLYLSLTMALLLATASLDEAAFAAVQVGLFLLVLVGVPIAIETLSGGRSLGKLAAGLRVVREDGGRSGFGMLWCVGPWGSWRSSSCSGSSRVSLRWCRRGGVGWGTCSRGRWWYGNVFRCRGEERRCRLPRRGLRVGWASWTFHGYRTVCGWPYGST